MKKKDLQEARTKTEEEISGLITKKKIELMDVKIKTQAGEVKNIKIVRNLRREIAQLSTILRESSLIKAMDDDKGGKQQ